MEFSAPNGNDGTKQTQKKSIIIGAVVLIGAITFASAQLSYHLDANTNSYSLQTPNSQQSFTRYFGSPGNAAGPIQTAQNQLQQSYQENGEQAQSDLYLRQQQIQQQQQEQELQQQEQELQQQQALQQQQQQPQQQQQQQQGISAQDLSTYYQQLQQEQQVQQQQPPESQLQQQQISQQYNPQQHSQEVKPNSNLLGVAFSPSNEVSQVKFSSNSLNYNF